MLSVCSFKLNHAGWIGQSVTFSMLLYSHCLLHIMLGSRQCVRKYTNTEEMYNNETNGDPCVATQHNDAIIRSLKQQLELVRFIYEIYK